MNWKKSLKVLGAICLALVIIAMPLLSGGCTTGSKVKVGFSICYTGIAADYGN